MDRAMSWCQSIPTRKKRRCAPQFNKIDREARA
jgi:hypothetical protein